MQSMHPTMPSFAADTPVDLRGNMACAEEPAACNLRCAGDTQQPPLLKVMKQKLGQAHLLGKSPSSGDRIQSLL